MFSVSLHFEKTYKNWSFEDFCLWLKFIENGKFQKLIPLFAKNQYLSKNFKFRDLDSALVLQMSGINDPNIIQQILTQIRYETDLTDVIDLKKLFYKF